MFKYLVISVVSKVFASDIAKLRQTRLSKSWRLVLKMNTNLKEFPSHQGMRSAINILPRELA